jgi:tetratricopeptide (TPR) repeat protein/predicted Ser/Thr protein kinase
MTSSATEWGEPALSEATMGRYLVVERIGQGGMGVVYKAYDPVLDRRVALKVLRHIPHPVGSEQERLLREGKAMARLAHPNVVAVYDVGVHDERVFVAMEFVEGKTLRAWLAPKRSLSDVLAMFVQAGRGLSAAHEAGFVHRDFKPDNVLVGNDGRVRVVDFGLARHAAHEGTRLGGLAGGTQDAASVETGLSERGRLAGTPRYMPPEQLAGERLDHRADQFAFCASLWEGLFGEPPFEAPNLLALLDNLRAGKLRAPTRRDVPRWLLGAIEKGLAADRDARHASMAVLLDVLERDPAAARRRWMIPAVGVTALAAVALVAARGVGARRAPVCPSAEPLLAGVWDEPQRAAMRAAFEGTGKPYRADAYRGAAGTLDGYASAWVAMRDDACGATLVRGAQSSELMDLRMACLDGRLAGLKALASRFATADALVVERAVEAANALPSLAECADANVLRAPTRLPDDPAQRARIDAVRRQIAATRALRFAAKPAEGVAQSSAAVADARGTGYRPLEAEALEVHGMQLQMAHDLKGAVATLEEAQVTALASHDESVETLAWIELVVTLAYDQRSAEGSRAAKQAHACLERDGGDEERLSLLLLGESRLAWIDGRYDDAVALGRRALEIRERILPANHPDIASSLNALGVAAMEGGDLASALGYHRRALSIRQAAFGPTHPLVASSQGNLAIVLWEKGDLEGAIDAYRGSLAIQIDAYGPEDRVVAWSLENFALALSDHGDYARALEAAQRAIDIVTKIVGPDSVDAAIAYSNLAEPLLGLHRWDEGIANATRRLEIQERANGRDYPPLSVSLCLVGRGLAGKGRFAPAVETLERAVRLAETPGYSPTKLARARLDLARVLRDSHRDAARAASLAALARAEFVKEGAELDLARLDADFPSVRPP